MIVVTNTFDIYREHKKYLKDNIDTIINDGILKLKNFEGLNKIIIIGYTPSFNDGDPCEHWSTPYYDEDLCEIASSNLEFFGIPDNIDDCDIEDYLDENPVNPIKLTDDTEISTIIGLIEGLVEEKHGTNFKVYIDLTLDEPSIIVEDYYCGY